MAKNPQYIVARGQIEQGSAAVARQGDTYKPRDAAEADRLLAAGVIVETAAHGTSKAAPKRTAKPAEAAPDPAGDTDSDADSAAESDDDSGNSDDEQGDDNA